MLRKIFYFVKFTPEIVFFSSFNMKLAFKEPRKFAHLTSNFLIGNI